MKQSFAIALAAVLAIPAFAADTVVTKEKHVDAMSMRGQEQPARDTTEVLWIGKDRARVEEGDQVTILRVDLEKMFVLDTKAKTVSTLDLPLDMKKYVPAEMAPMMDMMGEMKVTVTPTEDTKKIKDWNAKRYTVTTTLPMGGESVQEMWMTEELGIDDAAWHDMYAMLASANPFGGTLAEEMKKIKGFPVQIERTQKMQSSEFKAREAVVSVEQKEPAAGYYDVPEGYTEKPFDPMAKLGRMGGQGRRGNH